jgi:colanic acid/amylovoran biosynthesis glycosyltransferase
VKVTVLTGQFPKLSETFVIDQIIGLLKLGHDVRIVSLSSPEQLMQPEVLEYRLLERCRYAALPAAGLTRRLLQTASVGLGLLGERPRTFPGIVRLAWPLDSPGQRRIRLAEILSSEEVDVLHCQFGTTGLLAVEIRRALGGSFPVVTSLHGYDLAAEYRYTDLFLDGERFIATSQFAKRRLVELGCPADKIEVLPVGVQTDVVPWRERSLPPSGCPRLLSVSRLVPIKGIGFAITAIAHLRDRGLSVEYRIIGAGPLRDELEQQVSKLGLRSQVSFLGGADRKVVLQEMLEAHVLLLPSIEFEGRAETQGLVLQEAQATGLPVVASNVGGIPEGIINGQTGYLTPPGDADKLAEAVVRLVAEARRWGDMGRAGRVLVESRFDTRALVPRLDEIFRNVVRMSND